MVNINIEIKKRHLWIIISVFLFLVGVGFVVAYNSDMLGGSPSVMGHSAGEIHVDNGTDIISLQNFVNQGGLGGSISYIDCRTISIYSKNCNGVPGCSFNGGRLNLQMPAPWIVRGGNYNGPDYTDMLYVCKMVIN